MSQKNVEMTAKEAKSLRSEGNRLFVKNDYVGAEKKYTEAISKIEACGKTEVKEFEFHLLLSNRSACYLKRSERKLALEDAERACKISPKYVKVFVRKALALIALERFPEARKVILEALELEPENLFLKKTLTEIDLKLPVSSFESFMLHYSETKDMRVRLCCLATFWNASSECDRLAFFRNLNALMQGVDVNSKSIESMMKNYTKEQMIVLPMKNYKGLSLPEDWEPWYKTTSSDEKVKLLGAIWDNCTNVEKEFIKKDIMTLFLEKSVISFTDTNH